MAFSWNLMVIYLSNLLQFLLKEWTRHKEKNNKLSGSFQETPLSSSKLVSWRLISTRMKPTKKKITVRTKDCTLLTGLRRDRAHKKERNSRSRLWARPVLSRDEDVVLEVVVVFVTYRPGETVLSYKRLSFLWTVWVFDNRWKESTVTVPSIF